MIFFWSLKKVSKINSQHFGPKSHFLRVLSISMGEMTVKWDLVIKSATFSLLAQKASKVIIWLFSGFWESSRKMRGQFSREGGTQSWPGTAIVNHPLRHKIHPGLSYFPYIFYFVNFTISAAIRQGLFGSFENVIKEFVNFDKFCSDFKKLQGFLSIRFDQEFRVFRVFRVSFKDDL